MGPYIAEALGAEVWRRCEVSLIAGGKSNLTYLVAADGRELILRRPPLGHVLATAHDMVREYRVLEALADTEVPVPRPIHLCTEESVLGVSFYLMERRHGHIIRTALPAGFADSHEDRRRIAEALIDNLVALHAVDWLAVGLGDFGRPEGFMERQLRRWTRQWQSSQTRDLPEIELLTDELHRRMPSSPPPTIVHGDYRLDNVMLHPVDPGRIVAILDWEMATIGDPLADLGLLCVYWVREDDARWQETLDGVTATTVRGFPTRKEIVERYARLSGRDTTQLAFYCAFGFFKLAVVLEGIHARFVQGKTRGEGFERVGDKVAPLVEAARETLLANEI